jgi:hypothetical protein
MYAPLRIAEVGRLPFRVCVCDNREGFVTFSCRNLEAFHFSLP